MRVCASLSSASDMDAAMAADMAIASFQNGWHRCSISCPLPAHGTVSQN